MLVKLALLTVVLVPLLVNVLIPPVVLLVTINTLPLMIAKHVSLTVLLVLLPTLVLLKPPDFI